MKKNIGSVNALFPIPDVIVGTKVDGKVNFLNIAYVGIVDNNIISVSLSKNKYSARGLTQNKTFSVNMICKDMLVEADYVGIVSGKKVDKSGVFTVFEGQLLGAPLIEESPIAMECELIDTKEMDTHIVYFGQIKNTYCNESVLDENDNIDIVKASPLLYASKKYWLLGEEVAKAWTIGKKYKNK